MTCSFHHMRPDKENAVMAERRLKYGYNTSTGQWERCMAKPENVGKGRCHHADHQRMTKSEASAFNDSIGETKAKENAGNSGASNSISKKSKAPSGETRLGRLVKNLDYADKDPFLEKGQSFSPYDKTSMQRIELIASMTDDDIDELTGDTVSGEEQKELEINMRKADRNLDEVHAKRDKTTLEQMDILKRYHDGKIKALTEAKAAYKNKPMGTLANDLAGKKVPLASMVTSKGYLNTIRDKAPDKYDMLTSPAKIISARSALNKKGEYRAEFRYVPAGESVERKITFPIKNVDLNGAIDWEIRRHEDANKILDEAYRDPSQRYKIMSNGKQLPYYQPGRDEYREVATAESDRMAALARLDWARRKNSEIIAHRTVMRAMRDSARSQASVLHEMDTMRAVVPDLKTMSSDNYNDERMKALVSGMGNGLDNADLIAVSKDGSRFAVRTHSDRWAEYADSRAVDNTETMIVDSKGNVCKSADGVELRGLYGSGWTEPALINASYATTDNSKQRLLDDNKRRLRTFDPRSFSRNDAAVKDYRDMLSFMGAQ